MVGTIVVPIAYHQARLRSLWTGNGGEDRLPSHAPLTLLSLGSSSSLSAGCSRPQIQLLSSSSLCSIRPQTQPQLRISHGFRVLACLPSSSLPKITSSPTKLYVSGLSFWTSAESLRNAFQKFGELVEVNLVMDRIANRTRGFAFLRYATEEESKSAIAGMHGKFLDGRVIFVEVANPRSELPQDFKQKKTQF